MEIDNIVEKILSYGWPPLDKLVEFAVKRHGFGGDDGYYGITYPSDLDDHDRVNGYTIPEGIVEISYWDGEIKEVLIEKKEYLTLLLAHLDKLDVPELAREIRSFVVSCSGQPVG